MKNMAKGGKYSTERKIKDTGATFEAPPAFTGSHRKNNSVPRFKGAGTNFKGK